MADSGNRLLAGEPMVLLADRALYWPRRSRLMVADLHLGKADAFRSAGIALPSGGTDDDLSRLDVMLRTTGARELMVLGDFLHGPAGDRPWRRQWLAWRQAHAGVEMTVLAGNHDRALAGADLAVTLCGEAVDDGPFALRHAPEAHATLHVLCGHVHPVARLPGLPGRWPAFWRQPGCTVLPAFSRFTGGTLPALAPGEALDACVAGELVELRGPARPPRAGRGLG